MIQKQSEYRKVDTKKRAVGTWVTRWRNGGCRSDSDLFKRLGANLGTVKEASDASYAAMGREHRAATENSREPAPNLLPPTTPRPPFPPCVVGLFDEMVPWKARRCRKNAKRSGEVSQMSLMVFLSPLRELGRRLQVRLTLGEGRSNGQGSLDMREKRTKWASIVANDVRSNGRMRASHWSSSKHLQSSQGQRSVRTWSRCRHGFPQLGKDAAAEGVFS